MPDYAKIAQELYEMLESCNHFLMGMTLDPAIPKHAKEALQSKSKACEALLETWLSAVEGL